MGWIRRQSETVYETQCLRLACKDLGASLAPAEALLACSEVNIRFPDERNIPSFPNSSRQRTAQARLCCAFFDGEGSISLSPRRHSTNVSLTFTQVDRRILAEIAEFLRLNGVKGAKVYVKTRKENHSIHALAISSNDDVINALKLMIPCLRVKLLQGRVTFDYLQDKITGNQFIEAMNAEVPAGRRAGNIYIVDQPFKRSEGISRIWNQSLANARRIFREMASSPDGHRRFGFSAIERNIARGIETRRRILRLLCDGPKHTHSAWADSELCRRHVRKDTE